ncbi:unnamed protein product, partial [Urochloa humidicola]
PPLSFLLYHHRAGADLHANPPVPPTWRRVAKRAMRWCLEAADRCGAGAWRRRSTRVRSGEDILRLPAVAHALPPSPGAGAGGMPGKADRATAAAALGG